MTLTRVLPLIAMIAGLTGCSGDFDAIPQRCATAADPAACRQAGYDAFYVSERAKLRRVGGN